MPTVLPTHAARKDHIRILAAMPPIESPKPRPCHPYQIIARMSPEARNFAPIEHPQESSLLESGKSLGSKFRDVRKRRTRRRPIGVRCNMGECRPERRLNFWREADNFFKIIRPPN